MAARLEFKAISKQFARHTALDRLTLAVEPGEILGFLGPNGAGKTTAIHLALGFLKPTSGGGVLLGKPFGDARARARLGFVPDVPNFFAESAFSSVKLVARLNEVRDGGLASSIRGLLKSVSVPDQKKDSRKLSRGMQQRLAIAQALVNDPELLILDEPTSALDPAGVQQVRELLRTARNAGKSIFFSSHQLTEVEQICDRIGFLNHGRLLRYGVLDELLTDSSRVEILVRNLAPLHASSAVPARYVAEARADHLGKTNGYIRLVAPVEEQRRLIEAVWSDGGEIVRLEPVRPRLEDLFFEWSKQAEEAQPR